MVTSQSVVKIEDQISKLHQEATVDFLKGRELIKQAAEYFDRAKLKNGTAQKLMETGFDAIVASGVTIAVPQVPAKQTSNAKKSSPQKDTPAVTGKKRGRKPGSTNRKSSKDPVVLKRELWSILERDANDFTQIIKDYPLGTAKGFTIAELKEIIESEGKLIVDKDAIGTLIQKSLHEMKKEGIIVRSETDNRYDRVPGKELTIVEKPA